MTPQLLREVDEALALRGIWHKRAMRVDAPRLLRALRDRLVEIESERDCLKDAIVQWDGGLVNTPRAARTTDYVLRVFHAEQQAAAEAREAMSETLEAAEARIAVLEQENARMRDGLLTVQTTLRGSVPNQVCIELLDAVTDALPPRSTEDR